MNTQELIQTVANVTGHPCRTVRNVLETAGDVVAETLAAGEDQAVAVPRLGKFRVKARAAREIKLPSGVTYVAQAKNGVRFGPSIDFVRRLNGEV